MNSKQPTMSDAVSLLHKLQRVISQVPLQPEFGGGMETGLQKEKDNTCIYV